MQNSEQRNFLLKEARKASIRAAVQHNRYKSEQTGIDKEFHNQWREELQKTGEAFEVATCYPLESYLEDVVRLATKLQVKNPGINISHAQKSLGLYLKYLWCVGGVKEPPACPIDRAVLEAARIEVLNWTEITSLDVLRKVLSNLEDYLTNLQISGGLAQWELRTFNSLSL
jgi:hypothetical protein